MTRIVIVGASITGHTIALKLKERAADSCVTLVTEEPYALYDRRRLFDFLAGSVKERDLFLVDEQEYAARGITLMKGRKVSSVNTERRVVYFKEKGTLPYDLLVIASGSRPRIPDVPGNKKPGVFTMYSLEDARAFMNTIVTEPICIAGSGQAAVELAKVIAAKYKTGVKIVDSGFVIAPALQLNCDAGSAGDAGPGIDAVSGEIAEIIGEGRVQAVKLKEGKAIGVSAVIFMGKPFSAIDFFKNTPVFLSGGSLVVDDFFRANIEGIFASGSAARHSAGSDIAKTWDECVFEAGLAADALIAEMERLYACRKS